MRPIGEDPALGWVIEGKNNGDIAGTYLHGIFENGVWRRLWLNRLRRGKGLEELPLKKIHYKLQREQLLDRLADVFEEHVNIDLLLKP